MTQILRFPLELAQPARSTADTSGPAVRLALQSAWQLVHDGERAAARTVCSATIAVHQAVLARDSGLLLDTVTVLAAAHGFRAIERLLAATTGRSVRIRTGAAGAPGAAPGHADGTERHTVSEACLRDPWLLRQWSEQLLGLVPLAC